MRSKSCLVGVSRPSAARGGVPICGTTGCTAGFAITPLAELGSGGGGAAGGCGGNAQATDAADWGCVRVAAVGNGVVRPSLLPAARGRLAFSAAACGDEKIGT